jgi:hypothetical protein
MVHGNAVRIAGAARPKVSAKTQMPLSQASMDEAQVEGRLRQSRNGRGFDKEQTVSDKSNRKRIQRRKTFATKFHCGTTPRVRIRDIPAQKVRGPGTSVFSFSQNAVQHPTRKIYC